MAKEVEIHLTAQGCGQALSREEVEKVFDREVERFSAFMASLGDWRGAGPLANPEKMLLKTYLVHKYRSRLEGS